MKVKCKHCNNSNEFEKWNKETLRQCGEGFTPIEEGINSRNWYYICPECGLECYKKDREKV